MSCEELSEELSAYLDGELSPRERAALRGHLERCSRCREELVSLRAVSQLLGSLPQVQPSQEFSQALGREISAHGRRRWLRPIPLFAGDLIPGLAVAALLLIALTVAFVIPRFTSSRRQADPYRGTPEPRAELAEPVVARDEALAGPASEVAEAKLAPAEAEPAAAREMGFVAGEVPSGVPEAPPAAAGPLAERAGTKEAYDYTRGRAEVADLPPESGEGEADALKDDRSAGLLAKKADTDTLAQSSPVMSSAVRKAEEGRAGKAAPPVRLTDKAAERRTLAAQKPAFYTVVLHCSDAGVGQAAFYKALDEFHLLSTPGADPATVRRMSEKDLKEYSRVYLSLSESPDVVIFKEIKVLASDADLIRAVFAGSADLTYADANTDVAQLRRLLTSARQRPRARVRAAVTTEDTRRSRRLGTSLREARQAVETQEGLGPRREMVNVILVLKRRPEPLRRKAPTLQRAAPAREEPSGREGP